ncbi:hypothetical protein D3C84_263890 [compost metagenome]
MLHAEAVLLVDDHQGQAGESDLVLEQRVGADHHGRAAGDPFQRRGAGLALELAGQPGDLDAERRQPFAEIEEVLLGEDFGGRHQRHLVAGLQRLQGGEGGDHGLAGANIALDQAQHGRVLAEVVGDLGADPLLRAGGGETQVGEVLLRQACGRRQWRRLLGAHAFAQALQGQLVGQQFLEGQAVLGPVPALGEFGLVGVRRWPVQVANGLIQRAEPVVAGQFARQPVRQTLRAEAGQGLFAQAAQALLGQAFGARVDRRQGLFHGNRLAGRERAVFRVVDLQAGRAGTYLAVAAHLGAALEAFLLRLAEVVEAQGQAAAAVLQAHQQAAPAAHDHIGADHRAFDHGVLAGAQFADRHDAGAILVTQRKVEQHILQGFQADPGEFLGQGGADAFQRGDGNRSELGHGARLRRFLLAAGPPSTGGSSRRGSRWLSAAGSWRARRWPRCGTAPGR